jgi:phosphatidylglycerophosphate synthase
MTAHINGAYLEDTSPERLHPIKDRCWASHISAVGGALGVLGAREVVKRRFVRGAALAAASAAFDWADGAEARRFAKRNPKAAQKRQNEGGWTDQIFDRLRNIALGASVLTVREVPPKAKAVVGTMVLKEAVTGAVGFTTLANHYIKHGEGWPVPIPSADRGKESMWWVGTGLSWTVLGAGLKKPYPEASKALTTTATGLCAIGLVRGLQTVPEYKRVISEMATLTPVEQLTYEPNYKPHIVSRISQIHNGLQQRVQDFNDQQGLTRTVA